jgi:hypothetical protein
MGMAVYPGHWLAFVMMASQTAFGIVALTALESKFNMGDWSLHGDAFRRFHIGAAIGLGGVGTAVTSVAAGYASKCTPAPRPPAHPPPPSFPRPHSPALIPPRRAVRYACLGVVSGMVLGCWNAVGWKLFLALWSVVLCGLLADAADYSAMTEGGVGSGDHKFVVVMVLVELVLVTINTVSPLYTSLVVLHTKHTGGVMSAPPPPQVDAVALASRGGSKSVDDWNQEQGWEAGYDASAGGYPAAPVAPARPGLPPRGGAPGMPPRPMAPPPPPR